MDYIRAIPSRHAQGAIPESSGEGSMKKVSKRVTIWLASDFPTEENYVVVNDDTGEILEGKLLAILPHLTLGLSERHHMRIMREWSFHG